MEEADLFEEAIEEKKKNKLNLNKDVVTVLKVLYFVSN